MSTPVNLYSPDYDAQGNPKPSIPDLKDAIENARVDAEDFATATGSFTDADGNTYNKGAKGWATDAKSFRNAAQTAKDAAETAEAGAISAKDDAENAIADISQLNAVDGQADDISGTDLLDANNNVIATASGNSGETWYVRSKTDYYKSDGSQWVAQGLDLVANVQLERRFLDVKEAGAKLDGTTDDSAAIRQAISDVAAGGEVYVPPGTGIISENSSNGYCLQINKSLVFRLAPGATLKLADSEGGASMLQFGDGTTAIEGASLLGGGKLDGNIANNDAGGVGSKALCIDGPVTDFLCRQIRIHDHDAGGVEIDGESSSSRAERLLFQAVDIYNVGEGIQFDKADQVVFENGRIEQMTRQDCYEPHGLCKNWVLRDSLITKPSNDNSTIDIYPQEGDIGRGLIENVESTEGEWRVSVGSGTAAGDYIVEDLTIRDCLLDGANITIGDGGKFGRIDILDTEIAGPAVNHTSRTKGWGIRTFANAVDDKVFVENCEIHGWNQNGIRFQSYGEARDCEIYSNGQNTSAASNERIGVDLGANDAKLVSSEIYDPAGDQTSAVRWTSDKNVVRDNDFSDHPDPVFDLSGVNPTNSELRGNRGLLDRLSGTVTISSGNTFTGPLTDDNGNRIPLNSEVTPYIRLTPIDSLGNANYCFVSLSPAGFPDYFINVDQNPGQDVEIAFEIDPPGIIETE